MKTIKFSIALTLILGLFAFNTAEAQQRCERLDYDACLEDPGDFDYDSQSKVAALASGDTIILKMSVYSNQLYKFMVCYEPEDFGGAEIEYQIFYKKRRYKRVIKDIKNWSETVTETKKDEWGDVLYDNNDQPIEVTETVHYSDTVWATEAYYDTKMYYDSKNADKSYLSKDFRKSQSLIIRVIVNGGDPDKVGCASIMVGRKAKRTRTVTRYSPGREG